MGNPQPPDLPPASRAGNQGTPAGKSPTPRRLMRRVVWTASAFTLLAITASIFGGLTHIDGPLPVRLTIPLNQRLVKWGVRDYFKYISDLNSAGESGHVDVVMLDFRGGPFHRVQLDETGAVVRAVRALPAVIDCWTGWMTASGQGVPLKAFKVYCYPGSGLTESTVRAAVEQTIRDQRAN